METDINKMKKVDLIHTINKERAEAKLLKDQERIYVQCGYCGESENFATQADAEEWILDDMEVNCHDASDYTIVVGREIDIEHVPAKINFDV